MNNYVHLELIISWLSYASFSGYLCALYASLITELTGKPNDANTYKSSYLTSSLSLF